MTVKVAIVFHSEAGHTKAIAEYIKIGADKIGHATLYDCKSDFKVDDLNDSDAIIFGCPTYMGSVSGELKLFMEKSSSAWSKQAWRNKIAAGFTDSAALNGDKLSTLMQISIFALQHGMIWVGLDLFAGISNSKSDPNSMNRLGSWMGLISQSNTDQACAPQCDMETAEYFGERIATMARNFRSNI
ncbi:MAG: flavodoxin family protein [Alphaproteobacteria bacterium]|jgi:NAD(P)H dehydrogenase (quinone)|nr:flavodoxin family protein [Candidatus Jidaibacter sp.]